MKKIYIVTFMLVLSCAAFGQQTMQETKSENSSNMPIFDGDPSGEKLKKYLDSQISYPEEALKDSITGGVVIRFVIDVDGSVVDAEIIRSAHPLLDNEVLRVFKSMPKWTPCFNQGKPEKTPLVYPIFFSRQFLLNSLNKINGEGQ